MFMGIDLHRQPGARFAVVLAAWAMTTACSVEETSSRRHALEAYCTANVEGVGIVSVEDDYLPRVINCENGAASYEALKAQAVAARTYLYYRLDRTGSIVDGTSDQVFGCESEPGMQHYLAVAETVGEVLQHQGVQIAGFFVAGAHQAGPSCRGGTNDPTNTERFVTYNEGLSGTDVIQTPLGLVDPSNKANRGCSSQNGAHCLAMAGRDYLEILDFYYGADIEHVRAEGECIPLPPTGADAGPEGDDGGLGGGVEDGGCSVGGTNIALVWLGLVGGALLLVRRARGRGRGRRRRPKKTQRRAKRSR